VKAGWLDCREGCGPRKGLGKARQQLYGSRCMDRFDCRDEEGPATVCVCTCKWELGFFFGGGEAQSMYRYSLEHV
jgi:hypothetical protein